MTDYTLIYTLPFTKCTSRHGPSGRDGLTLMCSKHVAYRPSLFPVIYFRVWCLLLDALSSALSVDATWRLLLHGDFYLRQGWRKRKERRTGKCSWV